MPDPSTPHERTVEPSSTADSSTHLEDFDHDLEAIQSGASDAGSDSRAAKPRNQPPTEHQFKKGISGNPKGRPKGSGKRKHDEKVFGELVIEIFSDPITAHDRGRKITIPAIEGVLHGLKGEALKGKSEATRKYLALYEKYSKISYNLHPDFENKLLSQQDIDRILDHAQIKNIEGDRSSSITQIFMMHMTPQQRKDVRQYLIENRHIITGEGDHD